MFLSRFHSLRSHLAGLVRVIVGPSRRLGLDALARHLLGLALCVGLAGLAVAGPSVDVGTVSSWSTPRVAKPLAPKAATPQPAGQASVAPAELPAESSVVTLLGPGDVLGITVYGQPDLTTETEVSEFGGIAFPLIGSLRVNGLRPGDVEQMIAKKLQEGDLVKDPHVTVLLKQQRSKMLSILGEVTKPGRYPLLRNTTLFDILATAGGLTQKAERVIFVLRRPDGGGPGTPRLSKIQIQLDAKSCCTPEVLNLELLPDDVIFIPTVQNFYIHGEVKRPGAYPMERDMNVMQAISVGGGVTDRGTLKKVFLHRKDSAGVIQRQAASLLDPVQEGDVIFVDERLF